MDGTLAAIFIIASLTDLQINHCPTGCLAPQPAPALLGIQAAAVEFNGTTIGSEVALSFDAGRRFGPYQPAAMASLDTDGRLWIGAGARWSATLGDSPAFVQASLMPGIDMFGSGPDIGGNLQFRSALGLGWSFANGASLIASYDHRSNADTRGINPGLETISIRYSLVLDR